MSDDKIKISLDEAEQAEVPPSTVTTPDQGAPAPAKKYGRVDPPPDYDAIFGPEAPVAPPAEVAPK